jgi:hypothetical protein
MRILNPPDRRTPRDHDATTAVSALPSLVRAVTTALFLLSMLSFAVVSTPRSALAQTDEVTAPAPEVTATVGWQNVCKVGKWTAVRLTLPASMVTVDASQLKLILSANDPQGHLANFSQTPLLRRDGEKVYLSGVVKPGSLETPINVRLESNEQTLWQKRLRPEVDFEILRQETPLLITFGNPGGFDFSDPLTTDRLNQIPRVIDLPSPDDFSLNPLNYEMVHALVISDRYDLSEEATSAIKDWTNRGGHLMIASGSKIEDFKASKLFGWVPIKFGEMSRLRELNGFEGFVGRTVPIRVFDPVPSPRLEHEIGNVLVRELDGPIAIRLPMGFGRITFLAISINEAPVSEWDPLELAMIKLTDLPVLTSATGISSTNPAAAGRLGQSGLSDLKTQLQMAAQSDLQAVGMNVWTIILLGLLMALIVGPLDYAICRFVLKTPSLTWITLPVWIIVIAIMIVQWNQSRAASLMTVGKLNLIDLNLTSNSARQRSWITWTSPTTKRYDLNVTPFAQTLAWSGEPENAFGGMYRTRTVQLNRADYTIDMQASSALGIPALTGTVNSWESQTFSPLNPISWAPTTTAGQPIVESDLNASALGQITGTLTHHLPADVTNWILVYGPRVYFPRTEENNKLAKDQNITLNSSIMAQSELSAFLRRQSSRKIKVLGRVGEDIVVDEESYDPHSTDLTRLVQIITTYTQFRGREYTSMSNSELGGEDLTSLIELGQAILIAETDGITTGETKIDGKAATTKERSFVRMILPVNRVQHGLNQLPGRLDEAPKSIPPELPPEVPADTPSNDS